jgi:hypothetical protein
LAGNSIRYSFEETNGLTGEIEFGRHAAPERVLLVASTFLKLASAFDSRRLADFVGSKAKAFFPQPRDNQEIVIAWGRGGIQSNQRADLLQRVSPVPLNLGSKERYS